MVHTLITIARGHCLGKGRLDWTEYLRALSLRTCMESHNASMILIECKINVLYISVPTDPSEVAGQGVLSLPDVSLPLQYWCVQYLRLMAISGDITCGRWDFMLHVYNNYIVNVEMG